jgi:hypothetical protein
MRGRRSRRSLSVRLTPLLISRGLVRGISPTSARQMCGVPIRAFASLPLDGGDAADLQRACSSSSAQHADEVRQ